MWEWTSQAFWPWLLSLNWQTVVAVISALTALASAFIGPRAAYRTAINQTKLAAVATEHKEWLQEFRNDVAAVIAKAQYLRVAFDLQSEGKVRRDDLILAVAEITERLLLRLDPSVASQLEIMNLLRKLQYIAGCPKSVDRRTAENTALRVEEAARQVILTEIEILRGEESKWIVRKFREKPPVKGEAHSN
jgi:hypothetical protein